MSRGNAHRRSQEERRAETRVRLLEAAIDCLVELGWQATTTPEVAKRAGLTRGALQYHFPSRADLLADVAMYISEQFHDDIRAAVTELPSGPERTRGAIDMMWRAYTGRRAIAHTEVWVAARTDPDLHAALYKTELALVPETRRLLRQLFSEDATRGERLDVFVDVTAQFIRGLVLRSTLSKDSHWIQQDLELWKQIAEIVVRDTESGSGSLDLEMLRRPALSEPTLKRGRP